MLLVVVLMRVMMARLGRGEDHRRLDLRDRQEGRGVRQRVRAPVLGGRGVRERRPLSVLGRCRVRARVNVHANTRVHDRQRGRLAHLPDLRGRPAP